MAALRHESHSTCAGRFDVANATSLTQLETVVIPEYDPVPRVDQHNGNVQVGTVVVEVAGANGTCGAWACRCRLDRFRSAA